MAELSAERGPQPIRDAIWKALEPASAFDRASDAVARGNRKVFEEIGREFARLLALPTAGGAIDPTEFAIVPRQPAPGRSARWSGLPEAGVHGLRGGVPPADVKKRAELIAAGEPGDRLA